MTRCDGARPVWSLRGALSARRRDASRDRRRHARDRAGRMTALLGPNGAGKSTLLQLLLGTRAAPASHARRSPCRSGDARTRASHRRRAAGGNGTAVQRARDRRDGPIPAPRTVAARTRGGRGGDRPRDGPMRRIAFADRWLSTLSGGERQRVRLARALAQEPTRAGARRADDVSRHPPRDDDVRAAPCLRDEGTTIVLATHNLNLAARYADELVLIETAGSWHGAPGCADRGARRRSI